MSLVPVNSCPGGQHVGNKYKHLPSLHLTTETEREPWGGNKNFVSFFKKEKSKGKIPNETEVTGFVIKFYEHTPR